MVSPAQAPFKHYPEMQRFDSPEEAREVLRKWQKHLMRTPGFWGALILYSLVVALVVAGLLVALRRWVHISAAMTGGFIGGVVGGSAIIAINWLWRSRCRRFLRQELIERGVPICLRCGYDLRGQSDPRCPECGTPFGPA